MAELERLMQNLYEDKCTGTIPQTVFQTLMRKYETERAEKSRRHTGAGAEGQGAA